MLIFLLISSFTRNLNIDGLPDPNGLAITVMEVYFGETLRNFTLLDFEIGCFLPWVLIKPSGTRQGLAVKFFRLSLQISQETKDTYGNLYVKPHIEFSGSVFGSLAVDTKIVRGYFPFNIPTAEPHIFFPEVIIGTTNLKALASQPVATLFTLRSYGNIFQESLKTLLSVNNLLNCLPAGINLPDPSSIPGMPAIGSISLIDASIAFFDITLPAENRAVKSISISVISAEPWNIFQDPKKGLSIENFAITFQGVRSLHNAYQGSSTFAWTGSIVGVLNFPRPRTTAVSVYMLIPFPMSEKTPAELILPDTTEPLHGLTISTVFAALPVEGLNVEAALQSVPGLQEATESILVSKFRFAITAYRRRSVFRRAVAVPYYEIECQSFQPLLLLNILNVTSFSFKLEKHATTNASTGVINGTIVLGPNLIDLSFPFGNSTLPITLRPNPNSVVGLSDITTLIPGGAAVNIQQADFAAGDSADFPTISSFAVMGVDIFLDVNNSFSGIHFGVKMTKPWMFSSGKSQKKFVLTDAEFQFFYQRAGGKINAFIATNMALDGITIGLRAYVPFTEVSPLQLYVYAPYLYTNGSLPASQAKAEELATCPNNIPSFTCAKSQSIAFDLPPALVRDPISKKWVINKKALTLSIMLGWIMGDVTVPGFQEIGLDNFLDQLAVTEWVMKFQGSVTRPVYRTTIEQQGTEKKKWEGSRVVLFI